MNESLFHFILFFLNTLPNILGKCEWASIRQLKWIITVDYILQKGLFFPYIHFVSDEGWQLFAIFLFLSLYEFLMKSCWQLWKAKPIFYCCWVKKFLLSLNFYKSIQPWLSIMQWEWASAVAEKINDWEMTAREAWKRKKARGEGRGKTFLCTWLTTGWKVNDEKRSKMMMIKWH